jgi:hypothetical protein
MNKPVDKLPSRRDIMHTGLLLGAAALLGGCKASQTTAANLPGPAWPDQERPGQPATVPGPLALHPDSQPSLGTVAVIPRTRWTQAQPFLLREAISMNGVTRITVHHDAIPNTDVSTMDDAARRLNAIRKGHIGEGWVDIGYHYIIDPQGRLWEGRTTRLQGAHVRNQNEHNLGVMVMGNFDLQRPTPQALGTLDLFVCEQMRRYGVPLSRVFTHREIGASQCPGRNMQSHMVMARARTGFLAKA